MKTPVEMLDGTELGKREAFAMLARNGLMLGGTAWLAPFLMGEPLQGIGTVAQAGIDLSNLPWIWIASAGSVVAYVASIRRIPKTVAVSNIVQGSWKVPIGKTWRGKWVYHDFDRIPHCKVGGVTGAGKTKALETILAILTQQHTPDTLEIHVIDMKGGASFAHFETLPHIKGVYCNAQEALQAVQTCYDAMHQRLQAIRRARATFERVEPFRRILLVIDEGGELSPAYASTDEEKEVRKQVMQLLTSIARVGREPRVSLLYGTQRPSNETLPVAIRGQIDATLAFRTRSKGDSNVLMEHEGAETIENRPGRMIYQTPDVEIPVQGSYVLDETLKRWIQSYKADSSTVDKVEASKVDESSTSTVDTPVFGW